MTALDDKSFPKIQNHQIPIRITLVSSKFLADFKVPEMKYCKHHIYRISSNNISIYFKLLKPLRPYIDPIVSADEKHLNNLQHTLNFITISLEERKCTI